MAAILSRGRWVKGKWEEQEMQFENISSILTSDLWLKAFRHLTKYKRDFICNEKSKQLPLLSSTSEITKQLVTKYIQFIRLWSI